MSERYLSYSPSRRRPWTEHNAFPAKAIRLWREDHSWRRSETFQVYRFCGPDRCHLYLVPEEAWDGLS